MTDSADPESCYSPRRQCCDKLNNAPTSATVNYFHRMKESKTSAYFVFKFGSSRCARCVPRMEHAHIRTSLFLRMVVFFAHETKPMESAYNIAGGGLQCVGCMHWLHACGMARYGIGSKGREGSAESRVKRRSGTKQILRHCFCFMVLMVATPRRHCRT